MGQKLLESTLPRIAEALEAIATRRSDGPAAQFSPRELVLLYEAVEYLFADTATGNDKKEFEELRERLLVMTGQKPAPITR
jgi:hypothetical protein